LIFFDLCRYAGCGYFWLLMVVVQVQYWRVDNPHDVRSTDVILTPPANPCHPPNVPPEQLQRREVYGAVNDLWPSSTIRAGVQVLNQGNAGGLSDTIDFATPQ